jgi:hypothetical protein
MLKMLAALVFLALSGCVSYSPEVAAERSKPLATGAGIIGLQIVDSRGRATNYTGRCELRFVMPQVEASFPPFVRSSDENGPVIGRVGVDRGGLRVPFDAAGGAVLVFSPEAWMRAQANGNGIVMLSYGQSFGRAFQHETAVRLRKLNDRFWFTTLRLPPACLGRF